MIKKRRNPERTRSLLIEKTAPLFNTKGFYATSLGDITKATGLTKGALCSNFPNKEALALETYDYMANVIIEALSKRIRAASTAGDKLRAICTYYVTYVDSPPIKGGCPILNAAVESDNTDPLLRLKVLRTIEIMKTSLIRILQTGINKKQIRKKTDVEGFAIYFIAVLEGGVMLSRLERDTRSINTTVSFLDLQIAAIEKSA